MATSELRGDYAFTDGTVSFGNAPSLPASTVNNNNVGTSPAIAAAKTVHRHYVNYNQIDGTDVVTATQVLHVMRAAGTVISIEVRPTTAPTGGDKQFTVMVAKAAEGSGSWTNLQTGDIVMSNADTDDTLEAATVTATALLDGDAIRVVVTASGSTGSQGQGFALTVNLDENPS